MNTTITIPGDVEAAFAAAQDAAADATSADSGEFPAWCRQVAAAYRALAEVYDTAVAGESLLTSRLLYHAVAEAADARRDRAKELEQIAARREQEGQ